MSSDEFSLEQVLKHTRQQEERKQFELKALGEEERRLRTQLLDLRDKEEAQIRTLSERGQEGQIDVAEVDAALLYLNAIEGSIIRQLDVVADVEEKVLESREQLIEILREKQVLENLKQRQAAEAAAAAARNEAKAADDMTSSRFQRRAREA